MHSRTIVGVFPDRADATAAVTALRAAGFEENQIGVISRHSAERAEEHHTGLEETKTGVTPRPSAGRAEEPPPGLKAAPPAPRGEEGTGTGAAAGAAPGRGVGGAAAAGLTPPVGPIIAGGTLLALLASAGAG